MKKLIAILLAVSMLFCFAACQPTENTGNPDSQGNTDDPAQDSYSFTYNGTKIALHAPAAEIVAALGEPKSYSESTSCAFDGLDKTYDYGSFCLTTYPIGDKDYISGWWFVDDLVSNDENICIGSSKADVEAAYGTEGFNGINSYTVQKGSGKLLIIMKDDAVSSVQYSIVTD